MLGYISVENIKFAGLLSILILVSHPFILNRWRARKYWKNIKDDYDNNDGGSRSDDRYGSIIDTAIGRRLSISYMIRRHENYKQTVSMLALYSLSNIIGALVGLNKHLTYQSVLDVDMMLVAFLSLMIAPIVYFFISDLAYFDKAALKKATTELALSESISVKDVALASDEAINSLSKQFVRSKFVN